MALQAHGRRAIQQGIDTLQPIALSSVSSRSYTSAASVPTGRLPKEHSDRLKLVPGPVYVVFSYQTPIGWLPIDSLPPQWLGMDPQTRPPGDWDIPDVSYSPTTTNHQHNLRVATLPNYIGLTGRRFKR